MSAVAGALTGVQIEGNLIAPDLTADLIAGNTKEHKGQTSEDFGLTKADKLADEIAIAWGDAKAYWAAFQRAVARLPERDLATTVTREQWVVPLLRSLGYEPVYTAKAEVIDGQTYALSHRTDVGEDKPPIHVVGCRVKLEQRPPSGTPRLSAHALMQEYLNRTEHLWGIVTNGLQWRLLRDSSLMTRLTFIEFDLEQILNGENFAEFGLFYRLFHRSRLPQGADDADACLLEYYHQEAIQQGGRVRDRLRDGVEKALVLLGTGFLQHPNNGQLRQSFESGELADTVYYRQLLLLIYRLLFLMVAEARNLLLTDEDPEKARIYLEYYSVTRLRNLAERPSYRREGFQDLWQGLRVTFRLFDENWRGEVLGLSPLNGDLFGSKTLKHLDEYAIDNHELLLAIRQLSLYEQKGQLSRRVNYAALDVEELGSVYESLLDFHPQVLQRHSIYEFQLVTGSDRKTTGSYYTPPELVGQLIKSALEPVIEEKLKEAKTESEKEAALLSLKVCDPACGSGHFLLAAARRIGKELAIARTGEAQPGVEPLRKAIRDIVQNCIYGVDLNPLAVDLCKVALWIEGFNRGLPLNFLDHRIKCGNSLVGVLDLACLDEGIPDEAFKPVTGDDKQLASRWKKENKKQRETDLQGQLSLDFEGNLEQDRSLYAQAAKEVGAIAEFTTGDVRQKQVQYQQSRQDRGWWRDYSACNLWTTAFFMPLTEQNLQLLPTTAALTQLLRGNTSTQKVVEAANKLAQEKHFFHWCLEFPEVFEVGGFDCVLGNPPWERIKLQEKEFFASRNAEIANAENKAAREKLIKELPKKNLDLAQAFEEAKHDAEAQSKFIRESMRFPLTAVGDINTYAVFAETTRKLISPDGRVGVIVPTGIATDDTCKKFFGDLTQKQALASLYDFENREAIFSAVHRSYKFSLLAINGKPIEQSNFSFFLTQPRQIENQSRLFQLSPQDIALLNPNTLTCPVFRTRSDAELTKKIYQRVPVLENEQTGSNPWGGSFMRMFDMANDSGLFRNEAGDDLVPLYEAKMFHQFDHRWATYTNSGDTRDLTDVEKCDRSFTVQPRYWVNRNEVENRLGDKWRKKWLLSFRSICRSTDERTAIFSLLPKLAVGHKAPIILIDTKYSLLVTCFLANLNSLIFDFVTRQKIGATDFSYFIVKQLPIIPPEAYTQEDIEFISSRVLELVYTAWDMQPFAQDMGYDGEPFIWNSERRALLRAELDAYYAKLYGLTRDELRYILDPADVYGSDFPSETFRVLKNNEIKQFGEYRTQRLVLEAWDRMFG
ncbi:Eco57I restriction-modification methylase domain-containing protein [Chroococcidiopsis sp. CCNUC1]|uniref:Eco57I restriction-modification methylase domain-containing protein n=1 Tax=Chroococcidiopsis sp. CCNUC1 TaxID=2653189 RepID=UPI00202014A0|nr:N-6 DNA methylase [Chroococcidiopsis sp. CCNUC1]URD53493.1 N-6 DNA methylase [Chroococcidiopsis sp. CCNUC1]